MKSARFLAIFALGAVATTSAIEYESAPQQAVPDYSTNTAQVYAANRYTAPQREPVVFYKAPVAASPAYVPAYTVKTYAAPQHEPVVFYRAPVETAPAYVPASDAYAATATDDTTANEKTYEIYQTHQISENPVQTPQEVADAPGIASDGSTYAEPIYKPLRTPSYKAPVSTPSFRDAQYESIEYASKAPALEENAGESSTYFDPIYEPMRTPSYKAPLSTQSLSALELSYATETPVAETDETTSASQTLRYNPDNYNEATNSVSTSTFVPPLITSSAPRVATKNPATSRDAPVQTTSLVSSENDLAASTTTTDFTVNSTMTEAIVTTEKAKTTTTVGNTEFAASGTTSSDSAGSSSTGQFMIAGVIGACVIAVGAIGVGSYNYLRNVHGYSLSPIIYSGEVHTPSPAN